MKQKYKGQVSALLRQNNPNKTALELANYIDTLEEGIDMYDKMVASYRLAMTVLLCSNLSFGIFAIFMAWKGFF